MRNLLFLLLLGFGSCSSSKVELVQADLLVTNIDQYCGKRVAIEGVIIHICGVDGTKMKLRTDGGAIVKVVTSKNIPFFDGKFYKKRIRVQGLVQESRVDSSYVSNVEACKDLLCHIDNNPCKDSVWTRKQVEKGRADSLSQNDLARLRRRMKETGKPYVSTAIICADNIEIIEKEDN
ncbi:MAG: hypothetical protein AB7S48_04500 [Bacteroidales bacterium]